MVAWLYLQRTYSKLHLIIAHFIDIYFAMHKVQMHAGAISKLLYGIACALANARRVSSRTHTQIQSELPRPILQKPVESDHG